MIKELIEDLAYDKINLSQALTRAKIIAYKIKNNEFKEWLEAEINGYQQKKLPLYRIVSCDVFAEVFVPFARTSRTIPLDVSDVVTDLDFEFSFYEMRVTQSIGTLEVGLVKDKKHLYGYEYLPLDLVNSLRRMTEDGEGITAVKRRVQFSQIEFIIQQTKQKLLDTLLDLENEFPNLENEYIMTKENNEKAQNIITTNIYGSAVPVNITTGNHNKNEQTVNYSLAEIDYEKLRSLNVENAHIEELQTIVEESKGDKSTFTKKAFGWLASVSSSLAARGLYDSFPEISNYIQTFI